MSDEIKDEIVIIVPDENRIAEDGGLLIQKAEVKMKNDIWRFHQNDKDHWPSLPHGHNMETKEKIDPYTGQIWNIETRKLVRTYREKQLRFLYKELERKAPYIYNQMKIEMLKD